MVPARVLRTALAIAVLFSVVPERAAAQSEATPPEAVEFYRQAREYYEAGQYQEASLALERALVLDPDSPTLVFNLARVYELLGELDQALEMYERYQRLLPQQQAREQDRAESSIRRLRGAQESGQLAVDETPREVEALRQLPGLVLVRENGVADTAFWVTLLTGTASVAVGVGLGIAALDARSSADAFVFGPDGQSMAAWQARYATAETLGIATDVTLGAGGVLVIAAGLLYFLREHTVERAPVRAADEEDDESESAPSEPAPSLEASLGLGSRGGVAVLAGRF